MKYLFFFFWGAMLATFAIGTNQSISMGKKSSDFLSVCGDIIAIIWFSIIIATSFTLIAVGIKFIIIYIRLEISEAKANDSRRG